MEAIRRVLSERASLIFGKPLTLADLADRLGRVHNETTMVEEAGGAIRLTFGEAAARVDSMAAGIAATGAAPGDRVVVAVTNGYDQFLVCLAVARAGAVAVPVNSRMRPDEIEHVERDSEARVIVRDVGEILGAATSVPAATPGPDNVAAIFYTSGTTGVPKGARLTHRALMGQLAAGALWPGCMRRDEAVVALPVAHIMGFVTLLGLACAGIPVFSLPRFSASEVLDVIEQRRSTIFVGVPAMYRLLEEAGAEHRDLRSVRVWASGADVMPPELARRFRAMGAAVTMPLIGTSLGRAGFLEGYGMVETGGGVAAKVSLPGPGLPFALGRPFGSLLGFPLPPNRLRVVGDGEVEVGLGQLGELWVKGPSVLEGYHGDAAATAAVRTADGWLRTGDLVRRGPFGTVAFAGRAKDVIKSGGYSVYALELERAIEEHPDVLEAAALGLPDERMGEVPAVVVRVHDGASLTEEGLLAWAGEHLSGYKVPRAARIVDALPRTGTDKVAKRQLLSLFAA